MEDLESTDKLRQRAASLPMSDEVRAMMESLFSGLETKSQMTEVAEQKRQAAEQKRQAAEQKRQAAEQKRQAAEAQCKDAETRCAFALETVKTLKALIFGRRSEKLSRDDLLQLRLNLGGEPQEGKITVPKPPEDGVEEQDRAKTKRRRNHQGRTKLSDKLERVFEDIPVPAKERTCKCCGKVMHVIGHLEHERVEYVPAKLVVHVERREKLGCRCRQDAVTAPRKLEREQHLRAGASLLAQLVEAKCDDALPIWRQADQFKRLGFEVPDKTLYGYWSYATAVLEPVARMVQSKVLDDPIVGVDDTHLRVLSRDHPGGSYKGHLWCFVGHQTPLVAYDFTQSWEAIQVAPFLLATHGHIQCDDYKGYQAKLQKNGKPLVDPQRRLGCMMHVRRRFHQAYKQGDKRASEPIDWIKDLYEIERHCKDQGLDANARLHLRQERSLPIIEAMYTWVEDKRGDPTVLPKSKLGRAIFYAHQQRPFIERCFQDGRFEIDNGLCERMIREPAIGRKNYLFTGSEKAAKRLAAAYTLVQSCRILGFAARPYLIDVIQKLESGWKASQINELRPDRWKQTHAPDEINNPAPTQSRRP